jgi:hypothetical protein
MDKGVCFGHATIETHGTKIATETLLPTEWNPDERIRRA